MKCKNGENIEKPIKTKSKNLTKLDFEKQGLLRNVKAENLTKPYMRLALETIGFYSGNHRFLNRKP